MLGTFCVLKHPFTSIPLVGLVGDRRSLACVDSHCDARHRIRLMRPYHNFTYLQTG